MSKRGGERKEREVEGGALLRNPVYVNVNTKGGNVSALVTEVAESICSCYLCVK